MFSVKGQLLLVSLVLCFVSLFFTLVLRILGQRFWKNLWAYV